MAQMEVDGKSLRSGPDAPPGGASSATSPASRSPIPQRVREIYVHATKVERQLARTLEVNSTDLTAMEHLLDRGPMTASELARAMEMSTAATTHVIDRLTRAGHVRRSPHPQDRRKVTIEPVPASVDRTMTALLPIIAGVVEVVEARSEAEQAVIEAFLDDVIGFYASLLEDSS